MYSTHASLTYLLKKMIPMFRTVYLSHWAWKRVEQSFTGILSQSPEGIDAVHHYTVKKSWRKTPPAWPDVTDSLVRGTENFSNMKIELIRRISTTKTKFRNHPNFPTVFCSPAEEFSDNFPSTFRRMNHQKHHQRDSIPHPSGLQSTTLPLRHTLFLWQYVTALGFTFSVLVYLRQYCVFLFQYCINLRQYRVNLRQYCVFLRQYSVHLRQYSVCLPPVRR